MISNTSTDAARSVEWGYKLVFGALFMVLATLLSSCASQTVDEIELMPAPNVYEDALFNPLPLEEPFQHIPYDGVLYATDRAPASELDQERFYRNERGYVVRVGLANIQFGTGELDWKLAREVSMQRERESAYPVKISDVEEWGTLDSTLPAWFDRDLVDEYDVPPDASQKFAKAINAQLASSNKKHIYLYVHGYRVPYENPILVSAELWHFLGYNGAFIAYSWPSTPLKHAYIKDSDTSAGFSRNFRLLVEFLAENTDAEELHIIGFSNGTRLVTRALDQLALKYGGNSDPELWKKLKIMNVFLTGSDLDRGVFSAYLSDGLLNVSRHMTVYMSGYDKALGMSQLVTQRQRLGQAWSGKGGEMHAMVQQAVQKYRDKLTFVDVSDAEGAKSGQGHAYFLSSPLVSSDMLMTLQHDLTAEERGLTRRENLPVYSFPEDYIQRLWEALKIRDPDLSKQ